MSKKNMELANKTIDLGKPAIIYSHSGLRGIAAFIVLMTHLINQPKVSLGVASPIDIFDQAVDLFFILSGFILNWVYAGSKNQFFLWGKYLIARCSRILPLYYLTLLPFLPPYFATFKIHGYIYDHGRTLFIFLGNLFLLTGLFGSNHINWVLNTPSWSVSVEFIAYLLLFPILLKIKRSINITTSNVVTVICLVGLMSCYLISEKYIMGWEWTRFFRGIFGFSLGFFVCTKFEGTKRWTAACCNLLLMGSLSLILLSITKIIPLLIITLLSPIIVFLTAFDNGFVSKLLKLRIFQWTGERSYSIYLWHCPIIYVLFLPNITLFDSYLEWSGSFLGWSHIIVITTLTLIVSEISYRFFENPIRLIARNL